MNPSNPLTSPLALATLHQFKTYLAIPDEDTRDDPRLSWALHTASTLIRQQTGRTFFPHRHNLSHDANPRQPHQIALHTDMIAVYSVTDALGMITADKLRLDKANRLTLRDGQSFVWDGDGREALTVDGVWGWHDAYADAWRTSNDHLDVPISPEDNQITVTSVTAPDSMGMSPRFQQGQLIRIGADDENAEYVGIVTLDSADQTLTVMRGMHGTIAQAHNAGIALATYQPPQALVHQCLRIATHIYRAPDTLADSIPTTLYAPLNRWRVMRV